MSYTPNFAKMNIEQLKHEYENRLREQLQRQIDQIPRIVDEVVKSVVNEVVGNTLGISRDSWGKWDVRYHRGDHNFAFVHQIEEAAQSYVDANADKLTKTYLSKLTSEDTEQLKDDYKGELYRCVNELMSQKAQAEALVIFDKLSPKKKKGKEESDE
jgi:hypothetical protein